VSRPGVSLSEAPPPSQPPLLQQLLLQAESTAPPPSLAPLGQAAAALGQAHPLASGALAAVPPLPGSAPLTPPEDVEGDVNQALVLLNVLWTGPSVPPLPPSGCYGGILVSSAISEGLGVEAAEAAQAAARELGERPVKVLLPWYPAHPGIATFDQTKPAKVSPAVARDPAQDVPPIGAH